MTDEPLWECPNGHVLLLRDVDRRDGVLECPICARPPTPPSEPFRASAVYAAVGVGGALAAAHATGVVRLGAHAIALFAGAVALFNGAVGLVILVTRDND